MERFDTIIIGAGIAGMTVGYELSKHYPNILIVEKDAEIGGMVSSYYIDGFNIEKYYHHFFSHDSQLFKLFRELSLEDKVLWQEAPIGYYFNHRIFNLNTPLEILNCKFLSLPDKLKLGLAAFKLKYTKDFSYLDNITAEEWIIKNTSKNVLENFFNPLLKSKFGGESDISAAWLCARIKKRSNKSFKGEKLGYLRGGFQVLFDVLAEKVNQKGKILKNTEVESIIIKNNNVKGILAGGKEYLTDKIVSTVGAKIILNLCDLPHYLKMKMKAIKEQTLVCCLLGLRRLLIKPYWLNIKSESLPFGILIEHNNFVNLDEYRNTRLIYAITYCEDENSQFFRMEETEIFNIYLKALERQFALKREDVLWWRISKTTQAGPVYKKGFLKLIPEIESGINGLYLTGMIRSYPDRGINESIKDAQDCINLILKNE